MWLLYSWEQDLYWSNVTGWGDKASATRFTEEEKNRTIYLILGSQWVRDAEQAEPL